MEDQVETQESVEDTAPQVSEIEQRAIEMGWRPKEEFDGNEDDFIDAKEFVRRKPLFDKIESQGRAIKQLTTTFNALKDHYTKVDSAAYDRALRDLQAKQNLAIKEGDLEKYHELTEEIQEVRQEQAQASQIPEVQIQEAPAEFTSWKQRNSWYQKDEDLTTYADAYGKKLHAEGKTPTEVLHAVEKRVREVFSNKFTNPNRQRPGAVEGSTTGKNNSASRENYKLNEQEDRIMRTLVRQGVVTKEQYIADLKKIKGDA